MATSLAIDHSPLAQSDLMPPEDAEQNDPFLSASTTPNHHRFSHFDSQLFALGPTTSPEQAKRALEAHLAETERRIQEASKLGTSLVQQRKDLAERLKDVEKQQSEGDVTPELRQKLIDIEKEFNEVGRESARAFLPKSRVSSSEIAGSPFAGDGKVT
jgi:septal ring factor EnvC (AmiA/AmiB activator)